jgi:hypothetical protein
MPDDARTMPEACTDAPGHHVQLSIRTIADRLNGRSNGEHADDTQPSIAAIIASLGSRSEAERHVLAQALMPRRLMVRLRFLIPPIEVRILTGHPATLTPLKNNSFLPLRVPTVAQWCRPKALRIVSQVVVIQR